MNRSLSDKQKGQIFSNLKHKRVYKRIQSVRDLAHISDERVIPSLVERLSDAGRSGPDYKERVCDVAAKVLEQLDVPETKEIVKSWRADPVPFFRKALDWFDDRYEIPAVRELCKLDGDRVIEALMYAMGGYSQNVYEIARDEVVRRGKIAIPRLIQFLEGDCAFRRMDAAYLLGEIGDPSVIPELIVALDDPETKVRREAAGALGSIGDLTVVPQLIAALDDPKADVRRAVAEALGVLGDARAVKSLRQRLSDEIQGNTFPPKKVCDIAAESLQRIGTPEAIQAVEEWQAQKN